MPYQQAQNYYYQAPQYQPPRQTPLSLKGRPVTGIEEVRAAAIDFDGSVSFFPDLANGKIYTKQCNIDGTASLNMYELKEIPTQSSVEYVTKEEFNSTLAALKQTLAETNLVKTQTSSPEFNFK